MPIFPVVLQVHTVMSCHGSCLRFPTAYTVLAYLGCASIDADAVRVVYVARGDSRVLSCCYVLRFACICFPHLASISRPKF